MTSLERVQRVLVEQMDVDADLVTPEASIVSLDIDSMEMSLLVLELEEEFGLGVPDDDMRKFVTVRDIADYIETHLGCGA